MRSSLLLLLALAFGDCGVPADKARTVSEQVSSHKLTTLSKYPSVDLHEYTLITRDLERDRSEADSIIQTKMELPHAMQTKVRSDFERILARDFVFQGGDEFFDREGYIANRVADASRVKQADYRNVVVQFVSSERALVTYSNIVEDEPGGPGAWKAEMTWADIIVREDGNWKYQIVNQTGFKDLTTPKQK